MESKKEEACKAREIAAEKFRAHDLKGSYCYTQQAYDSYPELEGISELIAAMKVHLAAEARLEWGLIDWYAILQVNTFSNPELIKQQYRKLALKLHPEKNRSVEVEGAFKLIREAWAVLSDRFLKRKYDCVRRCLLQEEGDSEPNPIATSSKVSGKRSNEQKDIVMIEEEMDPHNHNKPHKNQGKQKTNQPEECTRDSNEKSASSPVMEDPSVKIVDPVSIPVQDSDFFDIDKDRTENCFKENQIWAVYDDSDGMPRYYALINKVVSLRPFEVQLSWIEGKDNDHEDFTRWTRTGIWRSCGEFKVGRKTTTNFLNIFSHLMKGEKAVAGFLQIFPRKGSVWALYKKWRPDGDESTPIDILQYEFVEVIANCTEMTGWRVIPLVKLDGFNTVYRRIQRFRWVLRRRFLRFSHQIPARRLLGNEGPNLPEGCWELDPAATRTAMD